MGRVVARGELAGIIKYEKKVGKKVVFTNGCFDLIHIGHIRYLREARGKGDILIVAVNSDSSTRKLKGNSRPVVPQEERAEILSSFYFVDYVIIFPEDTTEELINLLQPHILVKGGDYKSKEIAERKAMKKVGGEVIIASEVNKHSTQSLLERIGASQRKTIK
ncbi:D-glycero-beta-D-manno-heptose 1-phosphate adenylyltransferase [candidate division NPL-UPA2 bacterium Unc8]|uniref:D-glycero-beta-D-manno-heptose 1-phosphate adenylyltransferase n=1 Tax=candidate division NPL-UPA2 bacterium Unc8 TaxID=1980939 RepID=A0A399FUB1_UNCN2|nr:Bifunctional protein HldE [Bacillota bacterium]MBT9138375.1 Bifunctional protein HldE [Bacillota bacterium]MBT9146622.1 Bifunctional protein HldE [Bacillota bacterium]RIH99904.1 MAG: D-glycero-beta-D-manno-heptose 1-phosphate adenylyltransferase [candidate division NPL-UPA2 bacterium Unc8]